MVVKEVDKSTPKLQEAIAMGTPFPSAEIEFTKTVGREGESEVPYLKWELKNVLVTSYSFSGDASGDPFPTDTISLKFGEIKVTYTELDEEGNSKGTVEYSWKVEKGEK
jgi:type VI secretion system secreted protein Hcp